MNSAARKSAMSQTNTLENISPSSLPLFQDNKLLSLVFAKNNFLSRQCLSFLPGKPGKEWTFDEAVKHGHLCLVKSLYPKFRDSGRCVDSEALVSAIETHSRHGGCGLKVLYYGKWVLHSTVVRIYNPHIGTPIYSPKKIEDDAKRARYYEVIKFVLENCLVDQNIFYKFERGVSYYHLDMVKLLIKHSDAIGFDKTRWTSFAKMALDVGYFKLVFLLRKHLIGDEIIFRIYEKADMQTIKKLFLSGIKPPEYAPSKETQRILGMSPNLIYHCEDIRQSDPDYEDHTLLCFRKIKGLITRFLWRRRVYLPGKVPRRWYPSGRVTRDFYIPDDPYEHEYVDYKIYGSYYSKKLGYWRC